MRSLSRRLRAHAHLISGLLPLAMACTPTGGGGTPPPAAATPILETLGPNDPSGTPPPANAPFMYTKVFKFHIPSRTIFEVAAEGWLLRESTTAQCGDDGCYTVLSRNDDGTQTTYVIQVWPQAYKRFAHRADFLITDVSLNANVTKDQLASKPLKLVVLEAATAGGPPTPASIPDSPEWAALNETDTLRFRTIGLSSAQDADAYYLAVDPNRERTTLTAWRALNGFGPDDAQDDANAVYFNGGDLALGRSMHMKVKANGDIAYYVSNYPTVADAIRRTNLIATVAMEYTPGPNGQPRFMKYFVFFNDDQRVASADLDGNGQKYVPNLCSICHGQRSYTAGSPADVGARFLPFDLRTYQYDVNLGRAGQEPAFKQLNLAILQTNKSAATEALIHEWYRDAAQPQTDFARATQNDDAVPGTWPADKQQLYLDVVRTGCRSCHITRDGALGFGNYADLDSRGGRAEQVICHEWNMPNAKVTYEKFWLQHLAGPNRTMAAVLQHSGLTGWSPTTPCPKSTP